MKLLVDTHLLLQAAASPEGPRSREAAELMADTRHSLVFSAASIWEVAIKRALGRPDFTVEPRTLRHALLDNGYEELPITSAHAAAVGDLPPIHKDPFDRILIAQAVVEERQMTLLTADAIIGGYDGPIRLVD